jgi:ABC-2 type transport system permease protein/fluoroquinolone transport system permease protein
MKRFLSLFVQDLVVTYRSGHVLITAIILAIVLALVAFLPRSVATHQELICDATPEQALIDYLLEQGYPRDLLFDSREDLAAALAKQPDKIGLVLAGDLAAPRVEIIVQATQAEENIRLLQASLDSVLAELRGDPPAGLPAVELLRAPASPVPLNLNLIPIFLVFEVVFLGFFIVAVMVFQEKQEGTVRAYRVTPARTLAYVLSKTVLFAVLGLAYGGIVLVAAFGGSINYPPILAILVLSSSLITMLSLAVSVFFRDLSEWFFVGVGILLVSSLPMISYALPSFAPAWMTWLPTYPAVFAVRNVLFHGAGLANVAPALSYLLLLNLAAFGACLWAVERRLMKEGH